MLSSALQVADLVVKSPLLVKPQKKESSIFVSGIATAKTRLTKFGGKTLDNLSLFYNFANVINSPTLTWEIS